jgi:hypothetical protein
MVLARLSAAGMGMNVLDALSRLDIDSLKIQEETAEVWTLLSWSENNSISNIKWIIPVHTAFLFKEQAIVKDKGLRRKCLAQPHNSTQNIEEYDVFASNKTNKIYIPQSLRQSNKEYCPSSMNIYFIWDRLELKRLSGMQWHCMVLHKMLIIMSYDIKTV